MAETVEPQHPDDDEMNGEEEWDPIWPMYSHDCCLMFTRSEAPPPKQSHRCRPIPHR